MSGFCCGFGHSDCYKTDSNVLTEILEEILIKYSVENFLIGEFGNFDRTFFKSAHRLKTKYTNNVKLILVKPYFTQQLLKDSDFYRKNFDEIIIPEESSNAHYKHAITVCNRWKIVKSDYVISGVYKSYGGAFEAVKYANKKCKRIIYLPESKKNFYK